MTENQTTARGRRFRTFMRDAWHDQVRAHRALLQPQPYDEYLIERRGR